MLRAKIRKLGVAAAVSAAIGIGSLAGPAAYAVNLADDGLGEVALYQYYTVRNGWQTFFRIINTSDELVPVKVRFRRASDSDDVLDFVVALSPKDEWVGWTDSNVDGKGNAGVLTRDTSCLSPAPQLGAGPAWVVDPNDPFGYRKWITFKAGDSAFEGHVEVIALGRGLPGGELVTSLLADTKHNPTTMEPACSLFGDIFDSNPQNLGNIIAASLQFLEPNNVLKANGYLFKGVNGQGAGFDPVMLANFYNPIQIDDSVPVILGEVIQQIDDFEAAENFLTEGFQNPLIAAMVDPARPNMNDAFPPVSQIQVDTPFSILGLLGNFLTGNNILDPVPGPTTIIDEWDRPVDAVSAVLTRKSVVNEWAARTSPGGAVNLFQTEWVLTFPTRLFYAGTLADPIQPPYGPFSPAGPGAVLAEAPARFDLYNREEVSRSCASGLDQGETCDPDGTLGNETNVITFGVEGPNAVVPGNYLGSAVALDIDGSFLPPAKPGLPGRLHGWMELEFTGDEAELGLGSDPAANQVYDNQLLAYNFGQIGDDALPAPIDPSGLCVDMLPYPVDFDPANPEQPTTGTPVGDPPGSGRLPNSLLLTGMFGRPYLATVPPEAVEIVSPGRCDDLRTDDVNEATNATLRVQPALTYAGVPVIGFMFGLYDQGLSQKNYASIVSHSYKREVQLLDGLCDARYFTATEIGFPPGWQCYVPVMEPPTPQP